MKKMTIQFFVCFLIMIPSVTEAQRRTLTIRTEPQDSGYLKAYIYKYEKMAHNGSIIMIVGGSAFVVGAGIVIGSWNGSNDELITLGYITAGAGVVTAITGAIIRSTGRGRAEEYRIRLDNMNTSFYIKPQYFIAPKYSGFALTFRF
jgi:hypothetical protein